MGGKNLHKALYRLLCILSSMFLLGFGCGNSVSVQNDYDPLVDVHLFFHVEYIQALVAFEPESGADFYLCCTINEKQFTSPVWVDLDSVKPDFLVCVDVPDDVETVHIQLELWDAEDAGDRLCDISPDQGYLTVELWYLITTGQWYGDDSIHDPSGYGCLNGCDDRIYSVGERDSLVVFSVFQTDFDGDGIPFWAEVYTYGTDPTIDNRGEDMDNDGCPIEWEHHWGYNPIVWDDHRVLDYDHDGLTNDEEFLMQKYQADPFRRDLFVELDTMMLGPGGENCSFPKESLFLVQTVFRRHNIHFFSDIDEMGGEQIPFAYTSTLFDLKKLYKTFFLHDGLLNWRRGVFRYALIVYSGDSTGLAFVGEHPYLYWHVRGINTLYLSAKNLNERVLKTQQSRSFIYACGLLHELGHTMGIDFLFPPGCDNRHTVYLWQFGYCFFGRYKSVMNYRYTFHLLDYSDGSHGFSDYNDWGNLDLSFFEPAFPRIFQFL